MVSIKNSLIKLKDFKVFLGREVWKLFVTSIFLGLLWFMVESSFIFILQGFLRSLSLIGSSDTFLPDFYPATVAGSILCLFIYSILRSIVSFFKVYISDLTHQVFVRVQRERILTYSLSMAKDVSSHLALNIFGERIYQTAVAIQMLSMLVSSIVVSFLLFLFGIWLAPVELIVGTIFLVLIFLPLRLFNKKIDLYGKLLVQHAKELSKILVLGLRNSFLLKVYNQADANIAAGKEHIAKYEYANRKYSVIAALKTVFPQLAGGIIISLICLISLQWLSTSSMHLLSFIYLFMRLAQNLSEANQTLTNVRVNSESFRELYRWNNMYTSLFEAQSEIAEPANNKGNVARLEKMHFEVKDLKFNYSGQKELFNGVNLSFSTGDAVLISGESGVGKSTLLTLLLGVENPTSGSVLLNDSKVSSLKNILAECTSYVGPESYVIEGSIRENLLYACNKKEVSDDELMDALHLAQLDQLIFSSEAGLNRVLKDVTDLSTGQKQRLAIARALVRKPKLLVLDEATANLDIDTEKEIINVIKKLSKDIIVLIISHKSSFDDIATKKINIGYRKNNITTQEQFN